MRNFVAIISFAVLLLSCKVIKNPYINGETITYNAEDVPTYTLYGEHMTHDVFMGQITIIEDYILLCNLYAEDSIFTVYNLDVTGPIASFGVKGQGPDDFTALGQTKQGGVDNGDVYTWINDVSAVKLKRLNISKSIKEGKAVVDKEITTVPMATNCFYANDSLLVLQKISGHNLLIERYNPVAMEKISSVSAFDSSKPYDAFYVFNSSDIYDKDNDRYVSAMYSINQIDFIDANTDIYAVCVGDVTAENEMWDDELDDAKMQFYSDLRQTDKYLFALYTNKSVEDIDEGITDGPTEVQVFDKKESKLVAILNMDEYFDQIALDKYGRLYGADDDNNIYRYELPTELL